MAAPTTLHLDFETASRADLKVCGLDNYVHDPSTRVLMMAWAFWDDVPRVWLPQDEPLPEHLRLALARPEIKKAAFNAQFERAVLKVLLGIDTPVEVWSDAMINARYASVAGNLEFVGRVLGLDEDKAKLAAGKRLIKLFCQPNRQGGFNDRDSHPAEWAEFTEYCRRDVIAEREISHKLRAFALPPTEKKIFALDQAINDRGLPIDGAFVEGARQIVAEEHADRTAEFKALTGLENPNSTTQLLGWLKGQGYAYGSLGAVWVQRALNEGQVSESGRRGLELRQVLAKSSTAKLQALGRLTASDGRLRYQYVYGGAARTLRWSGRGFQPQNLKRPTIARIAEATEAVISADRDQVRAFGPPLEAVASCMRGAICAKPGKQLVVCDLSSIEVVGLGWLAGCSTLLGVFERGLDPYIEFASRLYNVPYGQVTKGQRQMGKAPVLGCGYGLGGGEEAVDKNGDEIRTGLWGYARGMGIDMPKETAHEAVKLYRQSYPEIPAAWRRWEQAAIQATQSGERQIAGGLSFGCVKPGRLLWIALPSGRRLHYIRPRIEQSERWDGEFFSRLSYEGQVIGNHWGRVPTWGGRLAENLTQAVARDVLAEAMLRAAEEGFSIIGHSHDEIICEEDIGSPLDVARLRECMIARPAWAPDLPLNAAGFMAQRYRKD